MTKITMPDPVAHIVMAGGRIYEVYDDEDTAQKVASCLDGYTATVIPLISTTQAEAYANARVRQALEEAAKIPRSYTEEIDNGLFGKRYPEQATAIFNASTNMADRIRALIPKENE